MTLDRKMKRVIGPVLAAGLGIWLLGVAAVPFAVAAPAKTTGGCTTSDQCTWPKTCVNGTCKQVNTFRIVPECATARSGIPGVAPETPTLTCMVQTFGRIAQLILGITGSLALLMFVYGGFLMVTSAGSQEKVSKGKTVLTNAIIGILIIMTSGLLIQYGMAKIGVSAEFKVVGQQCSKTEISKKDGKKVVVQGTVVQTPSGENKCVTKCPNTDLPGFDCVDTKLQANAGKYCIANLCPQGADYLCCLVNPTEGAADPAKTTK